MPYVLIDRAHSRILSSQVDAFTLLREVARTCQEARRRPSSRESNVIGARTPGPSHMLSRPPGSPLHLGRRSVELVRHGKLLGRESSRVGDRGRSVPSPNGREKHFTGRLQQLSCRYCWTGNVRKPTANTASGHVSISLHVLHVFRYVIRCHVAPGPKNNHPGRLSIHPAAIFPDFPVSLSGPLTLPLNPSC